MSIPVLKSGWLLRETTVLKRWKRNYFVFYADGNLSYFEDVSMTDRIGNVNLVSNCKEIKTALQCNKEPPEGKVHGCLMSIVEKNGDHLTICADSVDDALAWKMTIEQPLFINRQRQQQNYSYPRQVPQYPTYYYPNHGPIQVLYTTDGRPYYVHPQTQVVTVIHDTDPYYYRPHRSFLYGAAAGTLIGTAMWMPFWFC